MDTLTSLRVFCSKSENETLLHLAALEGMGLVFLPMWMAQTDITQGRLEKVPPGVSKFRTTLHAVYPSRKYLPAKVRTLVDFLASRAGPVLAGNVPRRFEDQDRK